MNKTRIKPSNGQSRPKRRRNDEKEPKVTRREINGRQPSLPNLPPSSPTLTLLHLRLICSLFDICALYQ
ncbi:hypothetical protein L1887_13451 [Cichorium endivia]|nr:hypothetical protein L1887_13451 [Cichorium endivia]